MTVNNFIRKIVEKITDCYIIINMCKMYYVSYETLKNELNLLPQNESEDRINLLFCNQLVKTAIEELGIEESQKENYLERIVIRVFKAAKEMYKNKEVLDIENVSKVFDAVKESVIVI